MKQCSLIVPIAADKPEYESHIPFVFRMDDSGTMYCLKAILGLELSVFDNIYITILQKHAIQYGVAGMLQLQIGRLQLKNVHICILENHNRLSLDEIRILFITGTLVHNGAFFLPKSRSALSAT